MTLKAEAGYILPVASYLTHSQECTDLPRRSAFGCKPLCTFSAQTSHQYVDALGRCSRTLRDHTAEHTYDMDKDPERHRSRVPDLSEATVSCALLRFKRYMYRTSVISSSSIKNLNPVCEQHGTASRWAGTACCCRSRMKAAWDVVNPPEAAQHPTSTRHVFFAALATVTPEHNIPGNAGSQVGDHGEPRAGESADTEYAMGARDWTCSSEVGINAILL